MTKAEVVKKMAEEAGITKKAAATALNAIVAVVHEALKKKEGKIRISDLGTFRVIKKKARKGVNPQTREKIKIAAAKVPRFSASRSLREAVKKTK
ncbi:MAG TPA: HU family DNA-binding protein [Desulfomonilaceae bacterium]|nr:HU family DNA-binding protein [Desulfomonilaceae bacterium]